MQQIIDEDEVKELKDFVKHRFADIAETYLRCADDYVNDILKAFEDGDAEAIVDAAHPLKSSSGNLGLRALSNLSRNIEDAASEVLDGDRKFSALEPMIDDLKDIHKKSSAALRDYL